MNRVLKRSRNAPESGSRSRGSNAAVLSGPAPRDLLRPAPHRHRRPARALAGALLVVAAVVAALSLYVRVGDRQQVLAVNRNVLAGEVLQASDLQRVGISSGDDVDLDAMVDPAAVVGRAAAVRLSTGAIIVPGALADVAATPIGRSVVAVEVPVAGVPVGLRERSRVLLILDGTTLIDAVVVAVPSDLAATVGGANTGVVSLQVDVESSAVTAIALAEDVDVAVVAPDESVDGLTGFGEPLLERSGGGEES